MAFLRASKFVFKGHILTRCHVHAKKCLKGAQESGSHDRIHKISGLRHFRSRSNVFRQVCLAVIPGSLPSCLLFPRGRRSKEREQQCQRSWTHPRLRCPFSPGFLVFLLTILTFNMIIVFTFFFNVISILIICSEAFQPCSCSAFPPFTLPIVDRLFALPAELRRARRRFNLSNLTIPVAISSNRFIDSTSGTLS